MSICRCSNEFVVHIHDRQRTIAPEFGLPVLKGCGDTPLDSGALYTKLCAFSVYLAKACCEFRIPVRASAVPK